MDNPPRTGTREYIIKDSKPGTTTSQNTLRTITTTIEERPPLWRRIFVENGSYKAVALIFTLMLFYIVKVDKTKESPLDIPVETIMPKDEIVTNESDLPKTLHVKIRGRWSDLTRALQRKPKPYKLDLNDYVDGTQVAFSMEKIRKLIGVPGITVQSVAPSSFIVRMAPRGEKLVPIQPELIGKPPKGYELDKKGIVVSPPRIRIWGILDNIKKISKLKTVPIDLSNLDKTTTLSVRIRYPNMDHIFADSKPVHVIVPVVPKQGKRRFANQPITVKDCPQGYKCVVTPARARIYLQGPEPALLDMDSGRFAKGLFIDASDFDPTQRVYRGVMPDCKRPASVACRVRPRSVTLHFIPQKAGANVPGTRSKTRSNSGMKTTQKQGNK